MLWLVGYIDSFHKLGIAEISFERFRSAGQFRRIIANSTRDQSSEGYVLCHMRTPVFRKMILSVNAKI